MSHNFDFDEYLSPSCLNTIWASVQSCSSSDSKQDGRQLVDIDTAHFAHQPLQQPQSTQQDASSPESDVVYDSVPPPSSSDSSPPSTNFTVSPASVTLGSFDPCDRSIWPDSTPENFSTKPFDVSDIALDQWLSDPLLTTVNVDPHLIDFSDMQFMTTGQHQLPASWGAAVPQTAEPGSSQPRFPLSEPTPPAESHSPGPGPSPGPAPAPVRPGRKRKLGIPEDDEHIEKRRRNNIAAAKCRQKKLDRISLLEEALAEMQKERDDLRILLTKREEEIRVYKEIVMEKKKG